MVLKWAVNPFNRFMKLREIGMESRVTDIEIAEGNGEEARIVVTLEAGFSIIDLNSMTSEDVPAPGKELRAGAPVKAVAFENKGIALCYTNVIVLTYPDSPNKAPMLLNLRQPLTWAAKIGQSCIAAGSQSIVDVWSFETGKFVGQRKLNARV